MSQTLSPLGVLWLWKSLLIQPVVSTRRLRVPWKTTSWPAARLTSRARWPYSGPRTTTTRYLPAGNWTVNRPFSLCHWSTQPWARHFGPRSSLGAPGSSGSKWALQGMATPASSVMSKRIREASASVTSASLTPAAATVPRTSAGGRPRSVISSAKAPTGARNR